jgi:sugar phosphate isomerase/epimerase
VSLDLGVALARLQEAVEPCVARARELDVALAFEANSAQRTDAAFVHPLRDAIDVAACTGLMIDADLANHWMEREIDETLRAGIAQFVVVQVSDFQLGTRLVSARVVPGDGDVPLGRLVRSLLDAGYRGPFELELVGPAFGCHGTELSSRERGAPRCSRCRKSRTGSRSKSC